MLCLPNLEEEKVEQGECVDLMRPDRLCLALVFKVPAAADTQSWNFIGVYYAHLQTLLQ